jgi:cell division protein FtsI/penicillin-binding protein 2
LRVFDASVEFTAFMYSRRLIFGTCVAVVWRISSAWSQEAAPAPTQLTPSWETQRQAATYALAIPAPRGQITDRNGVPLAQTRVSYDLSVVFPTPYDFTDRQVIEFVNRAVASAH